MKFHGTQQVWYINPFVYSLEQVVLSVYDDGYWIDTNGAYLSEDDLFVNFKEAKEACLDRLNDFYYSRMIAIKEML